MQVLVRRAPGGGLLLSTPLTPGWCVPARTPAELAQRMEQAWLEYACAAYARVRGTLYDLAATEEEIPPEAYAVGREHPAEAVPDEVSKARRRRAQRGIHDPEQWVELPDGRWLSPSGQKYGPQTLVASRVRRARGG